MRNIEKNYKLMDDRTMWRISVINLFNGKI